MTDREKLIELLHKAEDICDSTLDCDTCKYVLSGSCKTVLIADYLLANGVICPPCKVGDVVYVITSDSPIGIEETKVSQIKIKVKENGKISYRISAPCVYDTWGEAHWTFCAFEFGKTVFLTKEEAEAELEKRGKENA